jgi:hypothetical protein
MAYAEGITIASYLQFCDRAGVAINGKAFQNFFIAETRAWNGAAYQFAPFGIQGDLISNANATSTATIVLPLNLLTVAVASEAALNRWLLYVKYVLIGATGGPVPGFTEQSLIAEDLWVCSGYRQVTPVVSEEDNEQAITLELISPLNAVEARAPNCVLQDWQVGSLPVTGVLRLT